MNRWIKVAALCLAAASNAQAGNEGKDLEKVVDESYNVETRQPGIALSGYVDAGYVYNFAGSSISNTTGYAADGYSHGDFNLNAIKLVLEKGLSNENSFQAGFRADLMVGEDSAGTGANGTLGSSDSLYLQQALVIVRVPVGNGLDIQFGKLNSILGFEADERPANMNITLGINAAVDPGPSAGFLAEYPLTEQVTLLAGMNNGNSLDTNTGLDSDNDGYAVTGGFAWSNLDGNLESQFAFQWTPWGDPGVGSGPANQENEDILALNWWGTWVPKFANDKLLLALNTSYWTAQDYSRTGGPAGDDSSTIWVAAAYAKYQFTDIFSLAGRFEYAHSDDNQLIGFPTAGVSGSDVWTWTATAGFDLLENLLVRFEYRFDLGSDVVANAAGTSGGDSMHTVAAQAVYSF